MKKCRFLFFLLGLLLMVSLPALADQRVYELPPIEDSFSHATGDPWWSEAYKLLVSGDTVHFLKYRYGMDGMTEEEHARFLESYDEELGDTRPMDVYDAKCYVLNEQGEAVSCPDRCGDVISCIEIRPVGSPFFDTVITAQNETYLIDGNGQVLRWTPGADEAWELVVRLDMSGLQEFQSAFDDCYCEVDGDALYMMYASKQYGGDLYAFDLTSGERRLITHFAWAFSIDYAGPGKLLVSGNIQGSGYGRYYMVDCQSGEATELVRGLSSLKVSRFLWDRGDGWYYATYSDIQRLGMDKQESAVVGFSAKEGYRYIVLSDDGRQLCILAEQRGSYNFIVIDLQETDSKKLTINGAINLLNPMFGCVSSMTGDSPELAGVQFDLRDDLMQAYDVAQSLVTRDDSYDILIVNAASADLRSLYAKGYFVPLNDQPEVKAFFDGLYPVWQETCAWQDSIAAIPFYVYDNYQFMYNTELWEAHGLDVPTSYHELFAVIRRMDSEGLLEEYPLFDINGRETRSFDHLLYKLLGDYMLLCDASGAGVSFSDPVLEKLLQELSELRDLLDRHDERHLTGSPLMIFNGNATVVLGVQIYELEQYGEYAPMLLAMDETRGPVLQTHLTVVMINPYSKNIELAKAWVAHLAANPTEQTSCVFLTGMPDGIETEQSRIKYAEYEERSAELERQYSEAKSSGDPEAIEKVRDEMFRNTQPMHEWIVTPEHAQKLYQALPYAQVLHYNPCVVLMDNGDQPIQEYLSGKRSARELLQALQSLTMMIDAEGS